MQRSAGLVACLLALCLPSPLQAANGAAVAAANPIRKVVTLLEAMQKKVTAEAVREKELFEKFECYCTKGSGDLSNSIAAANTKIPALSADIKSSEEQKAQLEGDLKQAQVDRQAAKEAVAEANSLREKDAAAFAATKSEYETNIAAISKAVASLEKGMAGSFLQTRAAQLLRKLIFSKQDMLDADRQELGAFLAGGADSKYSPRAGEVTGILKQLSDSMSATLAEATTTEQAAIKSHAELVAAKKQEIQALTDAIETKTQRVGELAVAIVQMKNDLTDTEQGLLEDQQFLANLQTSCKTKKDEYQVREQTRSQELAALAETIKLLNDDDALELFKNTLPSPSSSFVQVRATAREVRDQALRALRVAQKATGANGVMLDLVALALRGKKVGFEKVLKMIDGMVELLKKEQLDDDHKKEYCSSQLDVADDKKKDLERSVSDSEARIADTQEGIAKLAEEIAALEAGIKELDRSVAQATEQRRKEHEEYQELLASNNAAKELLNLAKNRLNKFYSPKLYREPAKKELSTQDRIAANLGAAALVQISVHQQRKDAPGPAPETFNGAYEKKSQESTGVIAMIDLLIQDLDKELTQAGVEEKNSQADYEKLMKDAAAKRAQDSKQLTNLQASKASFEGELESHKGSRASAQKELGATLQYIQSLHAECDWLLQYFDTRKAARSDEVEALGKAKAVLAGAGFSLVQTAKAAGGFLRRTA